MRASVFDISREKISEPASIVKGVSSPRDLAIPIAMAVLPVPGVPPIKIARPAILPSLIMLRMIPAARLASVYNRIALVVSGKRVTYLANHALGDLARVKGIIETETTNVGVGADTFDPGEVLDFLDF